MAEMREPAQPERLAGLREPPAKPFAPGGMVVLQKLVHGELATARKRPDGLSETQLAVSSTIIGLLGDGKPAVSRHVLVRRINEHIAVSDDPLPLTAAAFSLAILSNQDTHLARLDAFGERFGFEQRQARRYSDRGLEQLARLIVADWLTPDAPQLDIFLVGLAGSRDAVGLNIGLKHRADLIMGTPYIGFSHDEGDNLDVELSFTETTDHQPATDDWRTFALTQPMRLPLGDQSTRLAIRWGPIQPRIATCVTGDWPRGVDVVSETIRHAALVSVLRRTGHYSTETVEHSNNQLHPKSRNGLNVQPRHAEE